MDHYLVGGRYGGVAGDRRADRNPIREVAGVDGADACDRHELRAGWRCRLRPHQAPGSVSRGLVDGEPLKHHRCAAGGKAPGCDTCRGLVSNIRPIRVTGFGDRTKSAQGVVAGLSVDTGRAAIVQCPCRRVVELEVPDSAGHQRGRCRLSHRRGTRRVLVPNCAGAWADYPRHGDGRKRQHRGEPHQRLDGVGSPPASSPPRRQRQANAVLKAWAR